MREPAFGATVRYEWRVGSDAGTRRSVVSRRGLARDARSLDDALGVAALLGRS